MYFFFQSSVVIRNWQNGYSLSDLRRAVETARRLWAVIAFSYTFCKDAILPTQVLADNELGLILIVEASPLISTCFHLFNRSWSMQKMATNDATYPGRTWISSTGKVFDTKLSRDWSAPRTMTPPQISPGSAAAFSSKLKKTVSASWGRNFGYDRPIAFCSRCFLHAVSYSSIWHEEIPDCLSPCMTSRGHDMTNFCTHPRDALANWRFETDRDKTDAIRKVIKFARMYFFGFSK